MRVTDLYDLKNDNKIRKRIAESLIEDIISVAEKQVKYDTLDKFSIKFKIVPVGSYK